MTTYVTADDHAMLLDLQLAGANLSLIEDISPHLLRAYRDLPPPPSIHRGLQVGRRSNRTASWIRGARGERWGYMAANVLYQIERGLRPNLPVTTPLTAQQLVMVWRIYHVTHSTVYSACAQRIYALWEALGDGTVHERICRCGRHFIADADYAPQACPWCTDSVDLRSKGTATAAANDSAGDIAPIEITVSCGR